MKLPRLSKLTWIVIGVLSLGLMWWISQRTREGLEGPSPGILYGPSIRGNDPQGIPIKEVKTLKDGRKLYISDAEPPYVKMVAENGENGYYEGTIAQFDLEKWGAYKKPGDGYRLKLSAPVAAPPPTVPAAPSPSTPAASTVAASASGAYAATCTKCTVINNQLSCSCDVTPK